MDKRNYYHSIEENNNDIGNKRKNFKFWHYFLDLIFICLLSLILSIEGIMLSDTIDMQTVNRYLQAPMLFFLNTVPLTLFMLLIYHLTARLWASFFLGGAPYLMLELVNRFKMIMRQEPLTPSDFLLGMEAANVIKLSELPIDTHIIFVLLLFSIFSFLMFIFAKVRKLKSRKSRKLNWPLRITGILAAVCFFIVIYNSYYKDVKLYNTFPIYGSKYSTVNQFKSRGFIYSFLVKTHTFKFGKPSGYSQGESEKLLETYKKNNVSTQVKLPNIFVIMGEAFFDIDKIPGLEFNKNYVPLENFNHIKEESYSGRIITSVFGGGTANTEFAVLTGHSLSLLNDMTSPYMLYLRKNTFSLARVLKNYGYFTMAFHAGDPWFYNRVNVYDYFGFDSKYFKTDMDLDKVDDRFGYISDMDTANFMLSKFKSHIESKPDVPFFNFTVNIENHGPYSKSSLGNPSILKRTEKMDDSTYNILNNYINGVSRCDKALGYLIDNFSKMTEPIVCMYFADHLPYLGEKSIGYKALDFNISQTGDLQSFLNQYETPYFIWSNKAAKLLIEKNYSSTPVFKGSAPQISVNYLATELFEYVGLNGGQYFSFLTDIKKTLPVITHRFFKENNKFTESLSQNSNLLLEQYRRLQYYMMMDKKAITP